jgi:hypothetical protein
MPPHVAARLADADLIDLAASAAQEFGSAAQALGGMPPHVVERLPDAALRTLAQATAQRTDAESARFPSPWGVRERSPLDERVPRTESMDLRAAADRLSGAEDFARRE